MEDSWHHILPASCSWHMTRKDCAHHSPRWHGSRGEPRWPADLTGSVTHAAGYETVAVAPRRHITALGIDMEPRAPLSPADWSRLLAKEEVAGLLCLPPPLRGHTALAVWCLKEALFKVAGGRVLLSEISLCLQYGDWQPTPALRMRLQQAGLSPEHLVMRTLGTPAWQLAAAWQYSASHTDAGIRLC